MPMQQTYLRVNRMFHLDDPKTSRGGWYFEVRDSQPRGPYATFKQAGIALQTYLNGLSKTQLSARSWAVDLRVERRTGQEASTR